MTALATIEIPEPLLPEGLRTVVSRLIYRADLYRSSCAALQTCEDQLRQFRSMQNLVRLNNCEIQMNKRRDALDEAIDELRSLTA